MATTLSTGTTGTGPGATGATSTGGTSMSTLSEWAGPYITSMLGRAEALSKQPYQTYQGPLTAGPSELQNKFFKGLGSLNFPSTLGQSFTSAGAPTPGQPGTTTPGASGTGLAGQYMNPYLQNVLQPQMQAMQRQADIQRNMLGAQAAKAGAFGGARAGLMGSQLNADLMRQQQQATGQAYATAFDKAQQQFNTEQEQARQLANMMAGAGAAQRDIEQQGITADYNEFLQQRDYPMKQVQFLQSMLQGLPISTTAYMPSTQNTGQQVLGGMKDVMALLQSLGIKLPTI